MQVFILFAQRIENYNGEFAPEALEAVTEFQIEENDELMQTLETKWKPQVGKEFAAIRWVIFSCKPDEIRNLLINHPTISARMVS